LQTPYDSPALLCQDQQHRCCGRAAEQALLHTCVVHRFKSWARRGRDPTGCLVESLPLCHLLILSSLRLHTPVSTIPSRCNHKALKGRPVFMPLCTTSSSYLTGTFAFFLGACAVNASRRLDLQVARCLQKLEENLVRCTSHRLLLC